MFFSFLLRGSTCSRNSITYNGTHATAVGARGKSFLDVTNNRWNKAITQIQQQLASDKSPQIGLYWKCPNVTVHKYATPLWKTLWSKRSHWILRSFATVKNFPSTPRARYRFWELSAGWAHRRRKFRVPSLSCKSHFSLRMAVLSRRWSLTNLQKVCHCTSWFRPCYAERSMDMFKIETRELGKSS